MSAFKLMLKEQTNRSFKISFLDIKLFFSLTDMQGNIKALKYALNHELVYRDSVALLHKVGKPVPPYQKVIHVQ